MHPDLLNNSLFLRYYQTWQVNPQSVVFTSIADFFLRYGLYDAALKICLEGMKHHPGLVSGRLVLAKCYRALGKTEEAKGELKAILRQHPRHAAALKLFELLEPTVETAPLKEPREEEGKATIPYGWRTITMAQIFSQQGHQEKAREIFESILKQDPSNREARQGLSELENVFG